MRKTKNRFFLRRLFQPPVHSLVVQLSGFLRQLRCDVNPEASCFHASGFRLNASGKSSSGHRRPSNLSVLYQHETHQVLAATRYFVPSISHRSQMMLKAYKLTGLCIFCFQL